MNELDKVFEAPSEMALPPFVRYCKERMLAGDRIEVELYRPDGAGSRPADLVIHRWENGQKQPPVNIVWDNGVNAGLVDLGIRAIDLQHEGGRFAFGIRAALRPAERKYGDGYLSAVLVELLDDSDLCKEGEIAEVRKFILVNHADRSRSYDECRGMIVNEIGGRAVELRDKLKYRPEEVKIVMTKALAVYLDERFSVSSRRAFRLL
jgi:hypothetical protein